MTDLLKRLVEADPEHFRWEGETLRWAKYGSFRTTHASVAVLPERNWDLAGWCLEQMQERWKPELERMYQEKRYPLAAEPPNTDMVILEDLSKLIRTKAMFLTPELIIAAYCEWKQAQGCEVKK